MTKRANDASSHQRGTSRPLTIDSKYCFTFQFLRAADFFSCEAARIESLPAHDITEETKAHHRAFVVGAITQATAALESEAYETTHHGPGSYLGTNEATETAREFLSPMCEVIDKQRILERFDLLLHLLQCPSIDHGAKPYRQMALAVKLRNELVHYKSLLGQEMERLKFIEDLRNLKLPRPPFAHATSNFLPHHILSAACARWATESAIAYLENFHELLGYPRYMDRFLSWRKKP